MTAATIIRDENTPAGRLVVEYLGDGFFTASIGGTVIVDSTVLWDRKDGHGAGVEGRLNGKPVFIRVAAQVSEKKAEMDATDQRRAAELAQIARDAAPVHAARRAYNNLYNEGFAGYNPHG